MNRRRAVPPPVGWDTRLSQVMGWRNSARCNLGGGASLGSRGGRSGLCWGCVLRGTFRLSLLGKKKRERKEISHTVIHV